MRKIIHIFLSLVIVYASTTSAYANTSIGGWTALDTITAGANNTINATKTAGGKVLKSAITIAPQAGKVGKYLLRGGAAGALALAVPQILGDGVDWVLDPANNQIKYKLPTSATAYITFLDNTYTSNADACAAFAAYGGRPVTPNASISGYWTCDYANGERAVAWPLSNKPSEGVIPIDTVSQKVIANADAGHAPSQEAVKVVALEGFAAGEHDAALDAAATEVGVDNPPDTSNPPNDKPVPFDPSSIIAAINALGSKISTGFSSLLAAVGVTNSKLDEVVAAENATADAVTAGAAEVVAAENKTTSKLDEIKLILSDFFNSDPPPEKTQKETDVPVDDLPPTKGASDFDVNYINFGGQCPVLPSFNVGIGGASSALTFDMTPLCDMAVKIRPAVIAIAYFIGLGVIASAIRET